MLTNIQIKDEQMKKTNLFLLASLLASTQLYAAERSASIYNTQTQELIGSVVFSETPSGLLITPNLEHLPAGLHGFHLHQHANCADHGNDAGAHFDPQNTNNHKGPYNNGHLGDLPVLYVTDDGQAKTPTLAPHLKLSDLNDLSVMIHANGDNYSDTPPLGGGGARIACGVIKE